MLSREAYRGSRKHVLDWTERPNFSNELIDLVRPVQAHVREDTQWMPRGYAAPQEARLERFGPKIMPAFRRWRNVHSWWLAHTTRNSNTPNWDIAMSCDIEGHAGLDWSKQKPMFLNWAPQENRLSQMPREQAGKIMSEFVARLRKRALHLNDCVPQFESLGTRIINSRTELPSVGSSRAWAFPR